jgi:hypothetical protein
MLFPPICPLKLMHANRCGTEFLKVHLFECQRIHLLQQYSQKMKLQPEHAQYDNSASMKFISKRRKQSTHSLKMLSVHKQGPLRVTDRRKHFKNSRLLHRVSRISEESLHPAILLLDIFPHTTMRGTPEKSAFPKYVYPCCKNPCPIQSRK